MRFLTDQDVYASTVRFLSGLGHDPVTAGQLGLAQAEDTELLRVAHERGRILVTRDRDFGTLVFVQGSGPGINDRAGWPFISTVDFLRMRRHTAEVRVRHLVIGLPSPFRSTTI